MHAGFGACVDRVIDIVERHWRVHGASWYVRHEKVQISFDLLFNNFVQKVTYCKTELMKLKGD